MDGFDRVAEDLQKVISGGGWRILLCMAVGSFGLGIGWAALGTRDTSRLFAMGAFIGNFVGYLVGVWWYVGAVRDRVEGVGKLLVGVGLFIGLGTVMGLLVVGLVVKG